MHFQHFAKILFQNRKFELSDVLDKLYPTNLTLTVEEIWNFVSFGNAKRTFDHSGSFYVLKQSKANKSVC